MSKIDPTKLGTTIKLDRRSTILLQAARSQTECIDEKHLSGLEDPGIDALRGSFGTFGSMIRARSVRRSSQQSSRFGAGGLPPGAMAPYTSGLPPQHDDSSFVLDGLRRHQLYDAPVPRDSADVGSLHASSIHSQSHQQHKRPTIKFDSQDVVHSYSRPGTGDSKAIHEHRAAVGSPSPAQIQSSQHQSQSMVYPPIPPPKSPLGTPLPTRSLSQQQQWSSSSSSPSELSPAPLEGNLLEVESPAEATLLSIATDRAVLADDSGHLMSASASSTSTSALLRAPTPGGKDVFPPHLERDVVTGLHSAPPTMHRFRSPSGPSSPSSPTKSKRKDLFSHMPRGSEQIDDGVTRISETLLSFPSITDSGRSEEIWDEEELERQKERARERDRERSFTTHTSSQDNNNKGKEKPSRPSSGGHHSRRYPKGDREDDREESVSLWRRQSEDEIGTSSAEGEGTGTPEDEMSLQSPLREGGIRLVSPGKKNSGAS